MNYTLIWIALAVLTILDIVLITKFDEHWRRIGIGNLIFIVVVAAVVLMQSL